MSIVSAVWCGSGGGEAASAAGEESSLEIAILLFDGITALDAVGPYEVLAMMPDAYVRFVAPERGAKRTARNAVLIAPTSAITAFCRL